MPKSWTDDAPEPVALQEHAHLRDPFTYRLKKFLLGAPLNRHSLNEQRLSKRRAFGILSSDCISSSAYGGEQILVALIPAFGLAAFSLFTPLISIILVMLLIIALSYRDVISTYTRAGGAYVVARENLGRGTSLVAAIELMFGYIITVAIQAAAGVAAIISAFPELGNYKVAMVLSVIALLTYINLRGVKDAGVIFVIPSYLFIGSMLVVFGFGAWRFLNGSLPQYSTDAPGLLPLGEEQGLITFAAILMILKAFANGSASLTGLEAVSDSVPLFESPEHINAKRTFTIMAASLGLLVIGIGWLAYHSLAIPYEEGTPTVISLVAKAALGGTAFGQFFFYVVQAGTTLILFAGANTCYSAFPSMVNIVANDGFLPKRLTQRGHKLAFSSGILFIAFSASILVFVSGASITTLAAIYALAVFIGFTITGLGMAKRSISKGSRYQVALHSLSGGISLFTVAILAITKFVDGTWLVVIGTPIAFLMMLNFNRQYQRESEALLVRSQHSRATSIARHDVTVLIDSIDIATVAAVRYARSLKPHKIRAVHFVIDDRRAEDIQKAWAASVALEDVQLELIDCPDRRIANSALDYAIRKTEKPDVELTILLPRRSYSRLLGRLLHDQTAEEIAAPISQLQRVVATIVPFDVNRITSGKPLAINHASESLAHVKTTDVQKPTQDAPKVFAPVTHYVDDVTAIGEIQWRKRSMVHGRVTSISTAPRGSAPILQVEVWDHSGGITLNFLGRREIAGLEVGMEMRAEGMVGEEDGQLVILNPSYELLI
ncbi:amino acid permease [Candidatus Planktophila versatilis]|uniref:amino acid permease n=1 Tax=Candidatus Planktophila versatilis TaxID=1884905 RepID=UPI003CEE28DE